MDRKKGTLFTRSLYTSPKIQPLLFWQVLLCAWLAGVAAFWRPETLIVLPLLALTDSRCWDRARLILLGLCAVAGFGYAGWREPVDAGATEVYRKETVSGTVQAVKGLYDRRLQIVLRDVKAGDTDLPGMVVWQWEGASLRPIPGQQVTVQTTVRPLGGFRNAEGDSSDYWQRQGVFWRMWTSAKAVVTLEGAGERPARWRETLRRELVERLNSLYPDAPPPPAYGVAAPSAPHGWGFIPALLFGDRYYLGAEDTRLLQEAGLAHSIALSGQHLAVVGLGAAGLLWLMGWSWPAVFLRMPRFALGLCLSLPLAALYLWTGDAPPSLVRAAVMLLCWAVLCVLRRPAAFTDAIFAALLVLTVLEPSCLTDVGVLLSFSAVGGLALIAPTLHHWWTAAAGKRWLLGLGGLLITSLTVQVSTMPVALNTFGWISPWFWLNLLWLPVLGVWVLPLAVLGLIFTGLSAATGTFAGQAAGMLADLLLLAAVEPCWWLSEGLRWLATSGNEMSLDPTWCLRPHWTAMAGFAALLVSAALTQGRSRLIRSGKVLCVAGLCLLFAGPLLRLTDGVSGTIRLRLLDVGQGQAALLEFPGERRVLVDGGGFRSARFDSGRDLVAPVLTANRPPRLDALIMSHADQDHARGLLFFVRQFAVGEVLLPQGNGGHDEPLARRLAETAQARQIPVAYLSAGDSRTFGPATLQMLAPLPDRRQADNDGLVVRLTQGDNHGLVLLPGDATKNLLAALERTLPPEDLHTEILVAPHHGSRHNIREDFIRTVSPRSILASCGQNNTYDFPSAELRELCAALKVPLRSTADEGEITIDW